MIYVLWLNWIFYSVPHQGYYLCGLQLFSYTQTKIWDLCKFSQTTCNKVRLVILYVYKKNQPMSHPKFIINATTDERFHFNLTAKNAQVILTSQTYTAKTNALNGIESVQHNSKNDENFEKWCQH